MLLLFLCMSSLAVTLAAYRQANEGWSTYYWDLSVAMELYSESVPESFAFQSSTGSILSGAFANTTYSTPVSTGAVQTVAYYSNSTGEMSALLNVKNSFGVSNLGVLIDAANNSLVWYVLSDLPAMTNSYGYCSSGFNYGANSTCHDYCGIAQVDSTTGQILQSFNLTFLSPGSCGLNDMTMIYNAQTQESEIFVTNYWNPQILKVSPVTTSSGPAPNMTILNNNASLLISSPNGLTTWTDSNSKTWLIISVAVSKLVKMDPSTGIGSTIQPGANTVPAGGGLSMDGLAMVATQGNGRSDQSYLASVLVAAGWTEPNGMLQLITSVDEWSTYDLRAVFNASCRSDSATAVKEGVFDVLVLCAHDFEPPYASIGVAKNIALGHNPIAVTIQEIQQPNMAPGAFAYDPMRNMLVFGSATNGTLRGFPYNSLVGETLLTYGESRSHVYAVGGGVEGLDASLGVEVNPNNFFESDCYALVAAGMTVGTSQEAGLYLLDLCQDMIVDKIALPAETSSSSTYLLANRVTAVPSLGKVYVTYGNQVCSVDVARLDSGSGSGAWGAGSLSNGQAILQSTDCAANNADFCVSFPDGIAAVTTNSGSACNNYLLISMLETGLARYNPATKELLQVGDPTGLLLGFAGMVLNADQTVLYAARNSFTSIADGGPNYQSVFAMTTTNNWVNASLVYSFQTNCRQSAAGNASNAPGAQLVSRADGTQDLLVLCNDGFGAGPYAIQRVINVNNVITNQDLSLGTCSSSSSSHSSSQQGLLGLGAVLGILFALLASMGVLFYSQQTTFSVLAMCGFKSTQVRKEDEQDTL